MRCTEPLRRTPLTGRLPAGRRPKRGRVFSGRGDARTDRRRRGQLRHAVPVPLSRPAGSMGRQAGSPGPNRGMVGGMDQPGSVVSRLRRPRLPDGLPSRPSRAGHVRGARRAPGPRPLRVCRSRLPPPRWGSPVTSCLARSRFLGTYAVLTLFPAPQAGQAADCRLRLARALALLPPRIACLLLDLGHLPAGDTADVLPVVEAWATGHSISLVRIRADGDSDPAPVHLVSLPPTPEGRSLPRTLAARVLVQRSTGICLAHRADPSRHTI
ncbi:hypothetical protein SAVIM40S_03902 [Streptomyces avidinii]|uniref:Uncharacterized protein n=1 Tax=Streptomyces avidinii TaxID=1895 RepID=A0ABS4KZ96_STRAV|nr:hypothetical protein [Streptomyces avidinii]